MFSKKQRILGLDIGSSTVKGVEVASSGGRYSITGYAQAEIASAGTLKDAVAAVLREGRFKSKQVVTSVSGRSVIVRYINTAPMKLEDLKASMNFEADKYIPFETEEVILDCAPLERTKGDDGSENMRVVLVAVKRELVEEQVRILQETGLFPHIIDVDCFALGNAFETYAGDRFAPAAEDDESAAGYEGEWAAEEEAGEDEAGETAEGGWTHEDAEPLPEEEYEAPEASAYAGADEADLSAEAAEDEEEEFAAADEGPALEFDIDEDQLPEEAAEHHGESYEEEPAEEASEEEAGEGEAAGDEQEVNFASDIPDLDEDQPEAGDQPQAQAPAARDDETVPQVFALIDIGAQKTNINIMQGRLSCFTREVYIGGEDMTEDVAKQLGLTPQEAEVAKRDEDRQSEVLEAVGPTLDDLVNEIFLSFDYFENQFDTGIEAVYISGGGSRLAGLKDVLNDTLGRRVSQWDPLEGYELSLPDQQATKLRSNAPQLAVAVGLASRLRTV